MTRIEAKDRYAKHVTTNRLGVFDCGWDVIDQIFDDLGTCEECKHAEYYESADVVHCHKLHEELNQRCYECETDCSLFEVVYDFGCNKFERISK